MKAQEGSGPATSSGPSSPELSLGGAEKKELTVGAEAGTKAPAIVYENVSFAYPTRPDVTVLHDFSCRFEAGKMTAVVGRSGSGKSTLVGLLEKWYKPSSGRITVDNTELETLDSKTLRVGIGYVQQVHATCLRKDLSGNARMIRRSSLSYRKYAYRCFCPGPWNLHLLLEYFRPFTDKSREPSYSTSPSSRTFNTDLSARLGSMPPMPRRPNG